MPLGRTLSFFILSHLLATSAAWAQETPYAIFREIFQLGIAQGKNGEQSKIGMMEQQLFSQISRAAQSEITANVEWGHERLHFGDAATIRAHITNNLDVPVRIQHSTFEMRVPCELYGDSANECPPLRPLSVLSQDVDLPPRGHMTMQWHFAPPGSSLWLSKSFRTSPNYQSTLSFTVNLPQVQLSPVSTTKPQADTGSDSKQGNDNSRTAKYDSRAIPITIVTPLPVDLDPWTLALWAAIGSAIGSVVHAAARTATLKRLRNGDYSLFSDVRNRQDEFAYTLSFVFVGIVLAALMAASLGISAEAKRLISARILDAQGAILFGFLVHFMTYDLGYNKLISIWRTMNRH